MSEPGLNDPIVDDRCDRFQGCFRRDWDKAARQKMTHMQHRRLKIAAAQRKRLQIRKVKASANADRIWWLIQSDVYDP